MPKTVFVKGISSELPPFRRPQHESFEWLAAAYARAAATKSRRLTQSILSLLPIVKA
jgi:hypothetical protein